MIKHFTLAAAWLSVVAAPSLALAQTPQQMQIEGRRLYLEFNCYSCHGIHALGGIGPNIQLVDDVNTGEAVLGGEPGGMISYKKWFNAARIADMAAYLAVAGTNQEPTFLNWWQVKPLTKPPQ
jgi:mono/diheme cytochrome c family protein